MRLEILSLGVDPGKSNDQHHLSMQGIFESLAAVVPEIVEFGPFIYTSPPLIPIGIGSQQQDTVPDIIPFYQDDHQQMDSFLNATIWNQLDKLITSRLNSAGSHMDLGGPRAEYNAMCDEAL